MLQERRSTVLKTALFITGFSGIVAEYVLATLATYFLGNAVVQWAVVVSLMMFCMGIGARITRSIKGQELRWLFLAECLLSLLVAGSAVSTYLLAAFVEGLSVWIYLQAAFTGLLIGMELPLAIRLNAQDEGLESNVSAILEKDYYGSLLGGIFFVFLGLPYLGLTHTPVVLGGLNLLAGWALLLAYRERSSMGWGNLLAGALVALLAVLAFTAPLIEQFSDQRHYKDKVVFEQQTAHQKIVLTEWKGDHWLYLDRHLQFATVDEALYHELLVHPAMIAGRSKQNVLVLGGGDGCAVREVLKHPSIQSVTLVDLDPAMTQLGLEHPALVQVNDSALHRGNVHIVNADAFHFMDTTRQVFDAILIDLPDPRSIGLSRMYSAEFYQLCSQQLGPDGVLMTQAGSPYFAPKAFACIDSTLQSVGFQTLPLRNHVPTMGEWGWMLGWKLGPTPEAMQARLDAHDWSQHPTRWLNADGMRAAMSFGKPFFDNATEPVQINRIGEPVLPSYYRDGYWDLY